MVSSADDVERLSHAVVSLNNDAKGMHELIQEGTEGLRKTIDLEGRAADELSQQSERLRALVEEVTPKLDAVDQLVGDTREAFDTALASTSKQVEILQEDSRRAAEKLSDEMDAKSRRFAEDFQEFEQNTLKHFQTTRSELQEDILNHKTAISAHIDSLENELLHLKKTVHGFTEDLEKLHDETTVLFRRCCLIGIGVLALQAVTIVVTVVL